MNESSVKELEHRLGYVFANKDLLRQALTRESALQEKVMGSALQSYQALEFVGDAALKLAIARLLFNQPHRKFTEAELHACTEKLIGNAGVLPEIADKLGVTPFIIKGKGEKDVTPKMKADVIEAVLGAISMDNNSQEILFRVVEKVWAPYLQKVLAEFLNKKPEVKQPEVKKVNVLPPPAAVAAAPSSAPVSSSQSNALKKPTPPQPVSMGSLPSTSSAFQVVKALSGPPSPRTQRLFSGTSSKTSVEQFQIYVNEAKDVNRRNVGDKGDTPLMQLVRRQNLRVENELPKIEILIKAGALWTAPNNKKETAESIAKERGHNISRFKAK